MKLIKKAEWKNVNSDGEDITYKDLFLFTIIGMIPIVNVMILIALWCSGRKVYWVEFHKS